MNARRRTFDLVLTLAGAVVTVVLIVAGALLFWGYSFANDNVHSQLAEQEIYFPTRAQLDHPDGKEVTAAMVPYLMPYAGQQVLTGAQAQAYADHFIAVHLSEMPYGGVYSKVSAASQAQPTNTALSAQAIVASIVSFCLAAVMAMLTLLGFVHWRRMAHEVDVAPAPSEPQDRQLTSVG
jgi:hypothetical protein